MTSGQAAAAQPAVPRLDFGRVSVFLGDKNGKYPDANQIIVRGSEAQAALDLPLVSRRIGTEIAASDLVILGHVHEDHMVGLGGLTDKPVYVPEADLAAVRSWEGYAAALGLSASVLPAMRTMLEEDFAYGPRPDAVGYADGTVWDLGQTRIEAVHMPGHTAGHSVLMIEPEGVAFIGDIDLTGFGPYYGDASSSLTQFRESLRRLPALAAKVWVTGHHRGVYTDRAQMLADLAAYAAKIDAREERLVAMIGDGGQTLDDLVATRLLYPQGYDALWVPDVERRTIGQHLEALMAAGRLVLEADGRYRRR